jgi:uncharacterized membrane protein
MTWHRIVFLVAAALIIWAGFVRKELWYPFTKARPETRMPTRLGYIVSAILSLWFIWLSFLK